MPQVQLPYDRHVGRYSPQLATAFVRVAQIEHGGRVLDVGCGTGALARVLAGLVGPEQVAAVDPSRGALDACAHAVPGADVRLGSAERLPCPDGEFGAVLAQLVIDKVDGPAALREMRPSRASRRACGSLRLGLRQRDDSPACLLCRGAGGRSERGRVRRAPASGRRAHGSRSCNELWSEAGLDAIEVGELVVGADYDDIDDAWWSFAAGVVGTGAYCASLEEETREALKAELHRRLGSPDGAFHLTARAGYARRAVPA